MVVGAMDKTETVIFFQAEDGIRDLVRSRGLGDVYKRQVFSVMTGYGHKWEWGAATVLLTLIWVSEKWSHKKLSLIHI